MNFLLLNCWFGKQKVNVNVLFLFYAFSIAKSFFMGYFNDKTHTSKLIKKTMLRKWLIGKIYRNKTKSQAIKKRKHTILWLLGDTKLKKVYCKDDKDHSKRIGDTFWSFLQLFYPILYSIFDSIFDKVP